MHTPFVPQGLLFATPECLKSPVDLVRLWLHEASRVYGDKLIDTKDMATFAKMKLEIAKSSFEVHTPFELMYTPSFTSLHRIWMRPLSTLTLYSTVISPVV